MLTLPLAAWHEMQAEAWRVYPNEACGVLLGEPGGDEVVRFVPIANEADSTRVFTLDGREFAKATLRADREGLDVIGVFHSHTHTAGYPSPTDEDEAHKPLVPPTWHWVIASLGWGHPEVHSYRVAEVSEPGAPGIAEEPLRLV